MELYTLGLIAERIKYENAPYISINTFIPLEGKLQTFIELQQTEIKKMASKSAKFGWLGNNVYVAHDKKKVVIVTQFKSQAAANEWWKQDEFQEHLAIIQPLLDSVDTLPVSLVTTNSPKLK